MQEGAGGGVLTISPQIWEGPVRFRPEAGPNHIIPAPEVFLHTI